MARYVMDVLWRKPGPLDSRELAVETDADALREAATVFASLKDDPSVVGYRLRNPTQRSDRIFYEHFRDKA
jgi:hypothetical protein